MGCGGPSVPGASPAQTPKDATGDSEKDLSLSGDTAHTKKVRCPFPEELTTAWILDPNLSDQLWKSSKQGTQIVPIKYAECSIELLPGCTTGESYTKKAKQIAKFTEHIYNTWTLYNHFPFDARDLSTDFKYGGLWSLDTIVVGFLESTVASIGRNRLSGSCTEATHFVSSLSLGAYQLLLRKREGHEEDGQTTLTRLRQGGDYERCVINRNRITIPECNKVVQIELKSIEEGGQLPTSAPHPLFDTFPGAEQAHRLEPLHLGQQVTLPAPGKTTLLIFWSSSCPPCEAPCESCPQGKKTCTSCTDDVLDSISPQIQAAEELWRGAKRERVQVIGIVTGIPAPWARSLLPGLGVTFPVVADTARGSLAKRYHITAQTPAVFVLDKTGRVRFYADAARGDMERATAAVQALSSQ